MQKAPTLSRHLSKGMLITCPLSSHCASLYTGFTIFLSEAKFSVYVDWLDYIVHCKLYRIRMYIAYVNTNLTTNVCNVNSEAKMGYVHVCMYEDVVV